MTNFETNRQARQFRKWIQEHAGREVPAWALKAAIDFFLEQGRAGSEDVEPCVDHARSFQASYEKGVALSSPPGLLIASSKLAQAIQPDVEKLRQQLFGKAKPRFRTLPAAARWIQAESRKQSKPVAQRKRKRGRKIWKEIQIKLTEWENLMRCPTRPPAQTPLTLSYPANGWVLRAVALPGTRLAILALAAKEMAKETTFSEHAVVAYILSGIRPLFPSIRHNVRLELPARQSWVSIELHSSMVTATQFRKLYEQLRAKLNAHRKKPLTGKHVALISLVDSLGGEPNPRDKARGTRNEFWGKVLRKWNAKHPKWNCQTWRALELAYRRFQWRSAPKDNAKL